METTFVYEYYCHVSDYFRLRPWTLQLTSIAFLTNALAILFGDLITGFNITFYIHYCHVLFGLFSISFIYAAIHPKMLNCVLFSMVGLGFHSVVFGLTYGAHASAFVPVIKVPAIFFISYKESFLRLATDRILIQSILTSIAPAICR